jgi:hypothetical protein
VRRIFSFSYTNEFCGIRESAHEAAAACRPAFGGRWACRARRGPRERSRVGQSQVAQVLLLTVYLPCTILYCLVLLPGTASLYYPTLLTLHYLYCLPYTAYPIYLSILLSLYYLHYLPYIAYTTYPILLALYYLPYTALCCPMLLYTALYRPMLPPTLLPYTSLLTLDSVSYPIYLPDTTTSYPILLTLYGSYTPYRHLTYLPLCTLDSCSMH